MNTIGNTMENGKLSFTRLFFRKSKNKKGEECYISKIKNYDILDDGRKKFLGDAIVIANTCGSQKSTINREGRWDVKVKKMEKGSGYVVVDAVYTIDAVNFSVANCKVSFTINGREEKLKTDDGKFIPLYFDARNWYEPTTIYYNIERKFKFLQLPPDFSTEFFKNRFLALCEQCEKDYLKQSKAEKKKIIAQTPKIPKNSVKTEKKSNKPEKTDLSDLKAKWEAKYGKR